MAHYFLTQQDLARISADTRLMVIRAADAHENQNDFSEEAWSWTCKIPLSPKNVIQPPTQTAGDPPYTLLSDHFAPGAPTEQNVDAVDFWGYWRPTEGALNAAFGRGADNAGYQPFCNAAGPVCDGTRAMGSWLGDGTSEPADPGAQRR